MSKHHTQRTWWDRLLSGALCLALALGLLPAAGLVRTAEAAHWAEPYAEQLVEWGVMRPEWAGSLSATVTRAEFVAMCNRAFGYKKLGSMPFTDVPSSAWYAEDINIAYNAGYFSGTSAATANPDGTLTREMAAVAVANNLMLPETVGESLGFTDSHDLHEWSRGKIGAAVAEGVISGFPDGSFRPQTNITRGELAALLVQLIGTPLDQEGSYELGEVYGNVVISSSNVTLRDTVIMGNLYVTGGVDLGNVLLENVIVLGRIVVGGGGVSDAARSSVILRNVEADELVIDSMVDQFVTVSAYGLTDIPVTCVRYDAWLEDSCAAGYGLRYIELAGESGTKLQLAGSIKEVVNKTPLSALQLVKGTAEEITVDEYATGSELLVDIDTVLDTLNLDVATYVYGKGDIINLNIWADGCEVDILPEHVSIRPGLTAVVDGEVIGSVDADELSSAPRLLSGYPTVDSLRPTSAEGRYAVNKPGTIYWAVSAIADGSVSEANLIKNPAYGGNILKDGEIPQSGSIDASSRVDYGRLISGLEPDGSYYISAILVDERDNRSPVKVVSFTTPDNTVPAFVEEPHMTLVSCEVAQVTTMVNKNCLLYWVLLPAGAAAPTASNFRSGSFGGNYGSGSINVVKNVPVSVQVNTTRLQEKTSYDLYLWLNDLDGTLSSDVVKVLNEDTQRPEDPSFTTPDETPPIVIEVKQDKELEEAIEFSFVINEAPATLYWAVVKETDTTFIRSGDNLNSERIQRKVMNGTDGSVIVRGSKDADGANTETPVSAAEFLRDAADTLSYATHNTHNFIMYYVARDAEENFSVVGSIPIRTLDRDAPTVQLRFPENKMSNGRPQADTNITLVFSEQVKGSESAKTFVELYSDVARYESQGRTDGDSLLDAAKKKLGEELEKYIELYYVEYSWDKPGTKLKPKGENPNEDFGWLDLSQATVTLKGDGTVELTLVNGKAVQLSGGMTYDFHFNDIYDEADNALVVLGSDGNPIKEPEYLSFTTVYAQVVLTPNSSEGTMTTVDGVRVRTINVGGEPIRLDACFDVRPQSTKNVAESVYWDLIMWCDTESVFEIYRKADAPGAANDEPWTLAATVSYLTTSEGISWNAVNTLEENLPVKDGLDQDTTYTYGIHFTSVRGIPEANGKNGDPEVWGGTINLEFSVVVGDADNISRLSRSMVGNTDAYYEYVTSPNAPLSEVGVYYDTSNNNAAKSRLDYKVVFIDTRAPEFADGYPMFTNVTSSSFTMTVMTKEGRAGKMYYVVAPVNAATGPVIGVTTGTNTSTGKGISINGGNDGSSLKDEEGNLLTGGDLDTAIRELDMTYIPTGGADRDEYEEVIYFMTGGDASDKERGKYTTPSVGNISKPEEAYPNAKAQGIMIFEPEDVSTAQTPLEIGSLQPGTWYYVYIVLQGSGAIDDVVQIYRVRTKDAEPPVIVMESRYDNATMTPNDYVDLSYVLMSTATLEKQSWYQGEYNWCPADEHGEDQEDCICEGEKHSILWAMMNRPGGPNNATYFDLYATPTQRYNVVNFLTNTNKSGVEGIIDYGNRTYDPSVDLGGIYCEFEDLLTAETKNNTYVLLAVAINHYTALVDTDPSHYGFAAADGLSWQNLDPPVFSNEGKYLSVTGVLRAYDTVDCTGTPDSNWYNKAVSKINDMYFTGSVTINFTNGPIYQVIPGSPRKAVVTEALSTTKTKYDDDEIYILDAIYTSLSTDSSDKDSKVGTLSVSSSQSKLTGAQGTFVLDFTGIQNGDTIMILMEGSIGGANPAGTTYQYRIRLTFDPCITENMLDPPDEWTTENDMSKKVGGFSIERLPV